MGRLRGSGSCTARHDSHCELRCRVLARTCASARSRTLQHKQTAVLSAQRPEQGMSMAKGTPGTSRPALPPPCCTPLARCTLRAQLSLCQMAPWARAFSGAALPGAAVSSCARASAQQQAPGDVPQGAIAAANWAFLCDQLPHDDAKRCKHALLGHCSSGRTSSIARGSPNRSTAVVQFSPATISGDSHALQAGASLSMTGVVPLAQCLA